MLRLSAALIAQPAERVVNATCFGLTGKWTSRTLPAGQRERDQEPPGRCPGAALPTMSLHLQRPLSPQVRAFSPSKVAGQISTLRRCAEVGELMDLSHELIPD